MCTTKMSKTILGYPGLHHVIPYSWLRLVWKFILRWISGVQHSLRAVFFESYEVKSNLHYSSFSFFYEMQLAEAGGSWIYSEMQLFCSCKMHLLSLFLLGSFQNAHVWDVAHVVLPGSQARGLKKEGWREEPENKLPNDDAPSHMQYNLEIAATPCYATIH